MRVGGLCGAFVGCTTLAAVFMGGLANAAQQRTELVARGEYVARAADCMSCHTAPHGKPYAGGRAMKTPFGSIFSANITPAPRTGIGSWTHSDFERALRQGIRKDGSYLYPAMPYTSYAQMLPGDLDALWAYVQSLPPVEQQTPANTLRFPMSVRSGLAVWQSLYFHPQPWTTRSDKSEAWNRGAYLVKVLGHCGECHTPRTIAQGLKPQQALTGGSTAGWYAPDISDDSLTKLGAWSDQQLLQFLATGETPRNGVVVGPMKEVVQDSLRFLDRSDLADLALYLKNQDDAVQSHVASPVKLPRDRLEAGRVLYADNCGSCHQTDGKGMAGTVPALAANDVVTAAEPTDVIMAILEGFPVQGEWGAMGAFGNSLDDDQIADITNYVRVAFGNDAAPNATPWGVARLRSHASIPATQPKQLMCPTLPESVMRPALAHSPSELKQAARDPARLSRVVDEYRAARPKSSAAQTVEALSAAYCLALAQDQISSVRMGAMLVGFSQRVAVDVTSAD